jgi:hypothetical protein
MGAIGQAAPKAARRWFAALTGVAIGVTVLAAPAAEAAVLKRVHSGTTTISSGTPTTIALELSDASKAFVVCSSNTSNTSGHQRANCVLSNNQLVVDGGGNVAAAMTIAWYVAEFETGVTVQRGTLNYTASGGQTSQTATLSPAVDCTKSFVVLGGAQVDTGSLASSADETATFRAVLGTIASPCGVTSGSTTSTLTVARYDTVGIGVTVAWQVVTMDGATVVARGLTSLTGSSVNSATFSPAVDPTAAFAVMHGTGGNSVVGAESEYFFRGDFSNCSGTPTTCNRLTFTRVSTTTSANHQVDIAWEVVRLDDGSSVQRGSTTSSGTTTTMTSTISAIDRSAAVPFFTLSGGSGTTNTHLDESSFHAQFPAATLATATTQLLFTRATSTSQTAVANWFVVSFYKCASSRICSVDATAGNATVTVSWSPIYDPRCVSGGAQSACEALVVRDTATLSAFTPSGTYTQGQNLGSNRRVVFVGAGQSFTDSVAGLSNGTPYFYRVYPKINGSMTYITDSGLTTTNTQVSVTPSASVAWSYTTTGGPTLNAPIAGDGKVYVVATPLIVNGAVQSYLSWFPESGGTSEAVVAGDQAGFLTSMDGATGARNWSIEIPNPVTTGAGMPLQAAMAVQMRDYTVAPYQCDNNAYADQYSHDLIFVVGRHATDRTKNQIRAIRADTDGTTPTPTVWTYPDTAGTPAMDRATGQPYVDYCRNRLWVSTGNNASQHSLWVIDIITGTKITSFPNLGDQTNSSPTLSYDGTTVYVGDAAGKLYAVDAATTGTTAKYSLQLPGTSPQITGFIWEDGTASPRRLYIPVLTSGNPGIWCVEDNGSALTACSSWSVNPRSPAAGSSPSQPLISDTAIFYPAADGKIYQINPADGTLVGTAFTVESGIQLGGISTEDLTQLYVGSNSGRTYRINLDNGNLP